MPTPRRRRAVPKGLTDLLCDIHACRLCPDVHYGEVPRATLPNWFTDLFLMAQAPSKAGVRVSGTHWVDTEGKLRSTGGRYLDRYLRRVGYSIDPAAHDLPRPYTTNVLQCFPGSGGARDRPPSRRELVACRTWWQAELDLLRPRAVVLLGRPAADAFGAALTPRLRFGEMLDRQSVTATVGNATVTFFTVPHPTAPYRGPRGGRNAYFDDAFEALERHLDAAQFDVKRT